MDLYNRFTQPGGSSNILTGGVLASSSGSISPDSLVHHVSGTDIISTINLPYPGFNGPIYLISDDGFSFDDSGNISKVGVARAKSVIPLLFDLATNKWYTLPVGFRLPTINITSPSTGPLGGLSATITANATAYNGATLVQAEFYYQDGGAPAQPYNLIGLASGGSPYSILWTFPTCGGFIEDAVGDSPRVNIYARAKDSNGQYSTDASIAVRLTGRGC